MTSWIERLPGRLEVIELLDDDRRDQKREGRRGRARVGDEKGLEGLDERQMSDERVGVDADDEGGSMLSGRRKGRMMVSKRSTCLDPAR